MQSGAFRTALLGVVLAAIAALLKSYVAPYGAAWLYGAAVATARADADPCAVLRAPLPTTLSLEAAAAFATLRAGEPPVAPTDPTAWKAFREQVDAMYSGGSYRHRAAFVASEARVRLGGVGAVRSAPKLGVGPGGGPAGGAAALDEGGALLYLHGGGYTLGSAAGMAQTYAPLSAATGFTAYSVEYRLAPEHPFPAALDDALAAYAALLERHAPGRVTVAGDSAGGGLAAALLLRAAAGGLPPPGATVLFSPWAVLNSSRADTQATLACADPFVTARGLAACAAAYTAAAGVGPDHPHASPAFGDFAPVAAAAAAAGRPPPAVLVLAGTRELLLSDAGMLARRMRAGGLAVELTLYDGMWHVWPAGPHGTLGLPEAAEAIGEAAAFVLQHAGEPSSPRPS